MWIYIVTWSILTVSQAPCPNRAIPNEFGVYQSMMTSCAVLHTTSSTSNHEKKFSDRDSAFAFYERGTKDDKHIFFGLGSRATGFSIDSIFTNDGKGK